MCPIGHDKVKNQGRISLDTFEKIVSHAVGYTDKIAMAVMGEPLMHPDLIKMVSIVKKHNLKAFVWTNGMLLDVKKAKGLLTAGVDKLFFSYEVIDKDMHEEIRVGADYKQVMQNLDTFIALKNTIRPQCKVAIWNIVPDINRSLIFSDDIKKKYADVELFASYAMDWHGEIDVQNSEKLTKTPTACNQIKNYLSVAYNGDFISCCNDFNHDYTLGNVHDINSLDDIWYSKQRVDLIEKMNSGNLNALEPCQNCSAPYVKEGVERVLHSDNKTYENKSASITSKETKDKV
jgi:radical SAM protein with 4Fe4S-binding SPASM domain